MDLLIWVIIAALVGAKALLFIVDFQPFHEQLAGVHDAAAIGRRVLRRPDRRDRRLHLAAQEAPPAAVGVGRSVRARHRARLHGRPPRLPDGRLLLRQAHRPWRGRSRSPIRRPTSTSARRSTCRCTRRSSTSRRAGLVILVALLLLEKRPGPFRRPHVLELRVPLCRAALRHRVLPRRRSRHGLQRAVDVAVHLDGARAAQRVHAVVPEPPDGRRQAEPADAPSRGPRKPRVRAEPAAESHGADDASEFTPTPIAR